MKGGSNKRPVARRKKKGGSNPILNHKNSVEFKECLLVSSPFCVGNHSQLMDLGGFGF